MGREKSSKKGGQNASSTPKNDIVELGLEEAIDLIGKKNTKLVWLGSEPEDVISRGSGFGADSHVRVVALPPKDILEYAMDKLNRFCDKYSK